MNASLLYSVHYHYSIISLSPLYLSEISILWYLALKFSKVHIYGHLYVLTSCKSYIHYIPNICTIYNCLIYIHIM